MKMKVSDLDGRALNWAVAYAISDMHRDIGNGQTEFVIDEKILVVSAQGNEADDTEFDPQGNWAHGGPLIERYATQLSAPSSFDNEGFIAATYVPKKGLGVQSGETFLVSFCRSLVSVMHQSNEIEIPDELCEVKS
ncbi:phage protein NinX family protein [Thalassospira aquimaris]|uniref:DUF2591 family protein n=1 Tax=Thalassospira aquimaris TaxID=3037796 RepID=A0ABT6GI31_9PROT|nr:phage protein NinX family protein [Thalassospira sp. FZY0004]MDG4721738.1 DUF2591 family protein [Thalassospira sp. FZY0004]